MTLLLLQIGGQRHTHLRLFFFLIEIFFLKIDIKITDTFEIEIKQEGRK